MPTTARQTVVEWLSDILAAMGHDGGDVATGGGMKAHGVVADGTAVTGVNPVLIGGVTNVGSLNRALRLHPFSDDGNSNATNLLQVQAGLRVLNGVGSLDRVRAAAAANGTTGTGLLGVGVLRLIGSNYVAAVAALGSHGNAWNNAATGAGGTSTAVDCQQTPNVSIFGSVSAATTLEVQVSQDNTNWYKTTITYVASGAEDVFIGAANGLSALGARYVRVSSTNDVTATITIAAKG